MTKEELSDSLYSETMCGIQYGGFPCNSCFHSIDLDLKKDIHEYWLAVLAFRGDYPKLKRKPKLIKELYNKLQ